MEENPRYPHSLLHHRKTERGKAPSCAGVFVKYLKKIRSCFSILHITYLVKSDVINIVPLTTKVLMTITI